MDFFSGLLVDAVLSALEIEIPIVAKGVFGLLFLIFA